MDSMQGLKRTNYCGTLRTSDIGSTATVCGWVQKQRDLGALIFVDLRDRSGILQLAFTESTDRAVFAKAASLRSEYVVAATGVVRERAAKNPELPTGDVELEVTELRLLAESETPPFEIVPHSQTAELTRLKYRYLDLRRPDLQQNILMRHKIAKITRDYFDENGFIEIETPMLIRSTPEGARDFLVPSRIHKGSFYALPQSPQLYKQLSMVAGAMKTCAPTANPNSHRSIWKCPLWIWRTFWHWARATSCAYSRRRSAWIFRRPCRA